MEVNGYDVTPPPPVEKVMSYDIDDLTQQEAEALMVIVGHIGGPGPLRVVADRLFYALQSAGVSTSNVRKYIVTSMSVKA